MKKDENTPHALGPFKPVSQEQIQAQKNVVLPSQKKDYLEAFIHHYCARTAKSKQKTAEYRARYADQRAVSFFICLSKNFVIRFGTHLLMEQ